MNDYFDIPYEITSYWYATQKVIANLGHICIVIVHSHFNTPSSWICLTFNYLTAHVLLQYKPSTARSQILHSFTKTTQVAQRISQQTEDIFRDHLADLFYANCY